MEYYDLVLFSIPLAIVILPIIFMELIGFSLIYSLFIGAIIAIVICFDAILLHCPANSDE